MFRCVSRLQKRFLRAVQSGLPNGAPKNTWLPICLNWIANVRSLFRAGLLPRQKKRTHQEAGYRPDFRFAMLRPGVWRAVARSGFQRTFRRGESPAPNDCASGSDYLRIIRAVVGPTAPISPTALVRHGLRRPAPRAGLFRKDGRRRHGRFRARRNDPKLDGQLLAIAAVDDRRTLQVDTL